MTSFDAGEEREETLGLLTTHAAAQWLAVSASQLEKWRCSGGGPKFIRIGRLIRYSRADIRRYLATCARRSTSNPGPAKTAVPAKPGSALSSKRPADKTA
jgi:predicted DNA-binding transcriptional regulator AlpA